MKRLLFFVSFLLCGMSNLFAQLARPDFVFDDFVVVIDPGHGYCACDGPEHNHRCPNGESQIYTKDGVVYYNHDCRCHHEIEVVLAISKELQRLFAERATGVKVFLTRNSNFEYRTDQERVAFVDSLKNIYGKVDLFLAIHLNAKSKPGMICETVNTDTVWSGTQTFYCSANPDTLKRDSEKSKKFFTTLGINVAQAGGFAWRWKNAVERGVQWRSGHFGVLKDNPAFIKGILEIAFLTFPLDKEKLLNKLVQAKVAEAIFLTIVEGFATKLPEAMSKTERIPGIDLPAEIKKN